VEKNDILVQKIQSLPKKSGVYVMRNKEGQVIYVGKAKNLKNRVSSYFQKTQKTEKVASMVSHIFDLDYFVTLSELDALALEATLIKKYQPHYNILLKDGKAFAYIKVNLNEDYPKFEITRKLKKDKCRYFGPYISGISVHEVLKILNLAFPLKICSKNLKKVQKRECLNYSLGLCSAPCTRKINRDDYHKIIKKAMDFLNGKDDEVEKILQEKMQTNANLENFEQAMLFRDRLKMLEKMKQRVIASVPKCFECDVFAYKSDGLMGAISMLVLRGGKILGVQNFAVVNPTLDANDVISTFMTQYYDKNKIPSLVLVDEEFSYSESMFDYLKQRREGGAFAIEIPKKSYKKRLVQMALENAENFIANSLSKDRQKFANSVGACQMLQNSLGLSRYPKRMECYDISNISGTNSVASMVVFENGEPDKKSYRKFKIKTVEGPNDFASMFETLSRRFERIVNDDQTFGQKPDLIVIDGGKGQLKMAYEAMKAFNIENVEMISLAKRFEEVYLPNNPKPIILARNSAGLKLLQRLRDEAHRFAITFHRSLRTKAATSSKLDGIKGLGESGKKNLLKKFKTIENIKNASSEELCQIPRITPEIAKLIKDKLQTDIK